MLDVIERTDYHQRPASLGDGLHSGRVQPPPSYLAMGIEADTRSKTRGDAAPYALLSRGVDVGVFQAQAGLTSSAYQTAFDDNTNAGRELAYLKGYIENGVAKFSAIGDSTSYNYSAAVHDRTAGQFQNDFDHWSGEGYTTRIVTGYRNVLYANYAGFCAKD